MTDQTPSRICVLTCFLILGSCTLSSDPATRIRLVTDGYFGRSLAEGMERTNVPGVSIAVIDGYEIDWAKGFGVVSVEGNSEVTPETLFLASSISKGVTSTIAFMLVEKGHLSLNEDVNKRLVSWRVPENQFTRNEKVSLLRLLDHTACVNRPEGGFGHNGTYPSGVQILNGEPPATNQGVRIECTPGSEIRYSNFGYVIVQRLIEDVEGTPFHESAEKLLFRPMGLKHITFQQPLTGPLSELAAAPHNLEGSAEGHFFNPNAVAQGGLWTTPTDLALFTCELMRARAGHGEAIFTQELSEQLLRTYHPELPGGGFWGPGFVLLGDWAVLQAGSDPGFRCLLLGFPKLGKGIVVMLNGEGGELLQLELLGNWVTAYLLLPRAGYLIPGGLSVLFLLSTFVVWPVGCLWKRLKKPRTESTLHRPITTAVRWTAVFGASFFLVAVYPYVVYILGPGGSESGNSGAFWLSLTVGFVAVGTALSGLLLWLVGITWRKNRFSRFPLLYLSAVLLAMITASVLWWKLIGLI